MTYDETKAAMEAVQCACQHNDAIACIDARYPGERRLAERVGVEVAPCVCRCHAIWESFAREDDDGA